MNEEIHCITNEGKMAKYEWENEDSEFLRDLCSAYKKLGQFFFQHLLIKLFKEWYITSVKSYKYLNTLIK